MAEADVTKDQPEPSTPFDRIGGTPVVTAMVERFYDLMDGDPAYADLRAMHASDLAPMRASLVGFLTGWMGGPRDWFASGKCVMSAHSPFAISKAVSDQWLDAMRRSIVDTVPEKELGDALHDAFGRMAGGMVREAAASPAE